MTKPLATIATPAAIEALVEDLSKESDSGNGADFELTKLGSKAIPFLMPLFEKDATSEAAARVIHTMGRSAVPNIANWSKQANDTDETLPHRLAALRAIGALGAKARPVSKSIMPLLSSSEPTLKEQAALTTESINSFESTVDQNVNEVSLIELIGNPEKYDGKHVRLIVFLCLEFEGDALYLHREDYDHGITRNGIWFNRPKDLSKKQVEAVDQRYVLCEGIFVAAQHGHMGLFSGELTKVNRLEPWR